jgi:hypothetical protein
MSIRVILRKEAYRSGLGVWVCDERDGEIMIATPIELAFASRGKCSAFELGEPTLHIKSHQLDSIRRSIIEETAGIGMEPLSVASQAELRATKYHLEDMRKLALRMP